MKLFISYSSKDKLLARKVAEQIRVMGSEVWIDEGELKPGDSFAEKITNELSKIDALIVILTNNSVSSNWVKFELNQFIPALINNNKKVIPLLFDSVDVPPVLKGFIYADCRSDNFISTPISPAIASITYKSAVTRSELEERLKSRLLPTYCIRLIPSSQMNAHAILGKSERKYVSVGDYYENYGKSLREILTNLFQGQYLEGLLNPSYSWVTIIFEVGQLYKSSCDLLPATWKAVFRILTDKRRLGMFQPSSDDYEQLGKAPWDYLEGNQAYWKIRVSTLLGGFPTDEEKLKSFFGIHSMCFEGKGKGPYGHRLFFVKNLELENLNHSVKELGMLDDGFTLQ